MSVTDQSSGPLPLKYSLAKRKFRIIRFWLLVSMDSVAFPIGLYYLLTRATTLSLTVGYFHDSNIDIVRNVRNGIIPEIMASVAEGFYFDFTHWHILASWVIIIAELVVGTIPNPPVMRMLAMPIPSLFFIFALEMFVLEAMYVLGRPVPFRVSSIPKGDPMRPALYPFLEDIIAVDGRGGAGFRSRLDQRYRTSPPFRGMLHRLTMLWAVPQFLVAGGTLAGIVLADRELAYTLGWSVPAMWAAIWVVVMAICIRVELRREKHYWRVVQLTEQLQRPVEDVADAGDTN
ncbi:hypothetical protein HFD88_006876 [Aspergillus terreus]|nr:hypothetical protein HFD88_006876 [Aspergillus terreus]